MKQGIKGTVNALKKLFLVAVKYTLKKSKEEDHTPTTEESKTPGLCQSDCGIKFLPDPKHSNRSDLV